MTNYTTLVAAKSVAGSIASWINSDQVVASAPTILAEAEAFIYRRLRHWRMLKPTTGFMVVGNDYVAVPADYLEAKVLMITGVSKYVFKRKTIEEVYAAFQYDGSGARVNQQPLIYSNNGSQLLFDSPSDQTYPYLLSYYSQPAALSGTNLTNFLTDTYPRLLRCAIMMGAVEFMKESGQGEFDRTYWAQNAMAEIGTAQVESDMEQRKIDGAAIIGGSIQL